MCEYCEVRSWRVQTLPAEHGTGRAAGSGTALRPEPAPAPAPGPAVAVRAQRAGPAPRHVDSPPVPDAGPARAPADAPAAWSGDGAPAAPADPGPDLRRLVPLGTGCGLLAFLPLLLIGPPGPLHPPAQVVADRIEELIAAPGDDLELHPVRVWAEPRSRNGFGQVHAVEYRCASADEVRVVAVTDVSGRSVHVALPMDEHRISWDGAAAILVCDDTPRTMLALLMAVEEAQDELPPGPQELLLMTRTASAERPTAIGSTRPSGDASPGDEPSGHASPGDEPSGHRYPHVLLH